MKQLLSEDKLVGKKIKRTDEIENYFFVFFDDDTFCVFHAPKTRGIDTKLMKSRYRTHVTGNNGNKMLEHGFCTQEEYDSHKKVLSSLREAILKDQIIDDYRKKKEEEYMETNKDRVTVCCGSKNHFLFQDLPYCHECNSVCELE